MLKCIMVPLRVKTHMIRGALADDRGLVCGGLKPSRRVSQTTSDGPRSGFQSGTAGRTKLPTWTLGRRVI